MDRRTFLVSVLAAPTFARFANPLVPALVAAPSWPQWGGPHRNFHADAQGLKDAWPATGPSIVWKRTLGNGRSAPVVERDVLITTYRRPGDEIVIAVSAETGATLWEHALPIRAQKDAGRRIEGANSTPLIADGRVYVVDAGGHLQCLEMETGKPAWTQHLSAGRAFGPIALREPLPDCNAIRVDDTLYCSIGGRRSQATLVAVDARSGRIHWQARTMEKAAFVWANRKLIALARDGQLILAHPSPRGFRITAKAPLLTPCSRTPPAVVGSRLYLRDCHSLMAVDLG